MADESDTTSLPPPAAPSAVESAKATGSQKRAAVARKWRRRLIRFIVIICLLVVAMRALVHVIFPPVLRSVVGLYGLTAEYDKLDLYMFGGDLGLWGLRVSPADGGNPVLTASYVRGSVSLWGLFRGKLHVERAEAEDADLNLERTADGKLPLVEKFLGSTKATAVAKSPTNSGISLDPPLSIAALRLQNARAHFRDDAMKPATDVTLALDLLIRDIGAIDRQTHVELQLTSPEALGVLSVQADGESRNGELQADFSAKMYGLNLLPAKAYLVPLGVLPTADDLQGGTAGSLKAKVTRAKVTRATTASTTQPAIPGVLSINLRLHDLKLSSSAKPAVSIDAITVDAPSILSSTIHIAEVAVGGARVYAERSADGKVRFAGIELAAAPKAPASQPIAPATKPTPVIMAATQPADPSPSVDLDRLLIERVRLEFLDRGVTPENALVLNIPELLIEHLSTNPEKSGSPARLRLHAAAARLARSIEVNGTFSPMAGTQSAELAMRVTGINPQAIEPYLQPLGIRSTLVDASFACDLKAGVQFESDGAVTAGVRLSDVSLKDQNRILFDMPRLEIANARFDATTSAIHVGDISLQGPGLPISSDALGIEALGFRYVTAQKPSIASAEAPGPATAVSTQPQAALVLPAIALDHLSWHGADFSFTDKSSDIPLDIGLKNLSVEARSLVFDAAAKVGTPGTLQASAEFPGLIEHLNISGHVAPTGESIDFDLSGGSTGISLDRIKPVLRTLGIEPALQDASLRFTANGAVRQHEGALNADFAAQNVAFVDGNTQWLALDRLRVEGASFDGHTAEVRSLKLDRPSAFLRRDAEGMLTVAGVRLLPAAPSTVVTSSADAPASPTRLDLALPIVAKIGSMQVNDANLSLHDDAVLPASDLSAKISATLTGFVAGDVAPPAAFDVSLSSPGVVEALRAQGHVQTNPSRQSFDLTATGSGISGQSLEPYLPPNVGVALDGAALAAKVSAWIEPNNAGGSKLSLHLNDATLRAGAAAEPLGAIGALRLDVERVDLPAKIIAIDEIAVEHAKLNVRQNEKGISVPGLTVSSSPLRAIKPPSAKVEPAATTQASDISALTAQARPNPPLIRIKKFLLAADRLGVETSSLGKPLVVTNASLSSPGAIELLGEHPNERKPIELSAKASVVDAIDAIAVDLHAAPFADDPSAKIVFKMGGIRGAALKEFLPNLQQTIDADDLKDGQLSATAEAQFAFAKRGLFGIDMTRDISGRFDLKDVTLADTGEAGPIAGVESIHGEGFRYSPADGAVSLKMLEVTRPSAHIIRDAAGVHLLGMTLKVAASSTQPTTAADPVEAPEPRALEITPASAPAPVAGGDMGIGQLTVSGLDLTIEDRGGKPTTILPITRLDVDVKGLSTAALTQPNKPIRFSAIVGAGKVPLPPRNDSEGDAWQPRDVFAEASAAGNFALVPKPNGYLKASLSGLELAAIRGLASEFGVTLGGGTFDVRLDARMNGGDSFSARVFPTFNELRLKEVPDGPIQRTFQLPAPPDVVISTLEDADGSITFPVNVPIEAGKLDKSAVLGSAVGAVGKVVAEAMLAAPLKAAKLVAMLGGADVSSDRTKGLEPVSVAYAPGESQLSVEQQPAIDDILKRMRDDPTIEVTIQHTLGQADLALAEQRANPRNDDSAGLARYFRQRKFDLQRQYSDAAVALRVAMETSNTPAEKAAVDRVRAVSTQLKENGDNLDELLDLLRPGASRQTERRTRASAVLLGDLRLRAVQEKLLDSKLPQISDRVRRANALFNPDTNEKPGMITIVMTRQAKS